MKKLLIIFIFISISALGPSCMSNESADSDSAEIDMRAVKTEKTEGSLRFKQEYEELNDVLNDDGTNRYFYLAIDEDNNIVYLTYEKLLDFTSGGKGLLYFGRPACPWCRLLIPYMLEYAKEADVNIYYYDIERDRDEDNEQYRNILRIFRGYFPTDTVTQNENDRDFNPGLKRVVLPQLFYMHNGAIKFDLLMFRHEYLENGESEKIAQLLHAVYNADNCDACK